MHIQMLLVISSSGGVVWVVWFEAIDNTGRHQSDSAAEFRIQLANCHNLRTHHKISHDIAQLSPALSEILVLKCESRREYGIWLACFELCICELLSSKCIHDLSQLQRRCANQHRSTQINRDKACYLSDCSQYKIPQQHCNSPPGGDLAYHTGP